MGRPPGRPRKIDPAKPITDAEQAAIAEAARRPIDMGDPEPEPESIVSEPVARQSRAKYSRENTREPTRELGRGGRIQVTGRNGEVLTRRKRASVDQFHIDPRVIPPGWTYQWNTVSIMGNGDVVLEQNAEMVAQGWRPVPADRHPGRYMPDGYKGAIIRGGLRLDERPLALTEEARQEEIDDANQLLRDRNQSLGLEKNSLPQGMEMGRQYRGTGGRVAMSIDPGTDIPFPAREVERH